MLLFAIAQLLLDTTPSLADLAPVVIIFILIIAAAGMTRGLDIFSFFGVSALLGITRGAGAGGAGKGMKPGKSRSKIKGAMKGYSFAPLTAALTGRNQGQAVQKPFVAVAAKGIAQKAGVTTPATKQGATVAAAYEKAGRAGLTADSAGLVTMAVGAGVAAGTVSGLRARRLQKAQRNAQQARAAADQSRSEAAGAAGTLATKTPTGSRPGFFATVTSRSRTATPSTTSRRTDSYISATSQKSIPGATVTTTKTTIPGTAGGVGASLVYRWRTAVHNRGTVAGEARNIKLANTPVLSAYAGRYVAVLPLVRIPIPVPFTRGPEARAQIAEAKFQRQQYLAAKAMGVGQSKTSASPPQLPKSKSGVGGLAVAAAGATIGIAGIAGPALAAGVLGAKQPTADTSSNATPKEATPKSGVGGLVPEATAKPQRQRSTLSSGVGQLSVAATPEKPRPPRAIPRSYRSRQESLEQRRARDIGVAPPIPAQSVYVPRFLQNFDSKQKSEETPGGRERGFVGTYFIGGGKGKLEQKHEDLRTRLRERYGYADEQVDKMSDKEVLRAFLKEEHGYTDQQLSKMSDKRVEKVVGRIQRRNKLMGEGRLHSEHESKIRRDRAEEAFKKDRERQEHDEEERRRRAQEKEHEDEKRKKDIADEEELKKAREDQQQQRSTPPSPPKTPPPTTSTPPPPPPAPPTPAPPAPPPPKSTSPQPTAPPPSAQGLGPEPAPSEAGSPNKTKKYGIEIEEKHRQDEEKRRREELQKKAREEEEKRGQAEKEKEAAEEKKKKQKKDDTSQ